MFILLFNTIFGYLASKIFVSLLLKRKEKNYKATAGHSLGFQYNPIGHVNFEIFTVLILNVEGESFHIL